MSIKIIPINAKNLLNSQEIFLDILPDYPIVDVRKATMFSPTGS